MSSANEPSAQSPDTPPVVQPAITPLTPQEAKRQKIGMYVFSAFTMLPGMASSGFFDDLTHNWPGWIYVALATVGGAIGGAIWAPAPRWRAGLFGGMIAGAGIVCAIEAYTAMRIKLTTTFIIAELIIPFWIGALPGIYVYRQLSGSSKTDRAA